MRALLIHGSPEAGIRARASPVRISGVARRLIRTTIWWLATRWFAVTHLVRVRRVASRVSARVCAFPPIVLSPLLFALLDLALSIPLGPIPVIVRVRAQTCPVRLVFMTWKRSS